MQWACDLENCKEDEAWLTRLKSVLGRKASGCPSSGLRKVQELAQRSALGHDNRREPTSGPSRLFLLQDGAAGLRSVVGDDLWETSSLPSCQRRRSDAAPGRWGGGGGGGEGGQWTSQIKVSCERKALGLALSAHRISITSMVNSTVNAGYLLSPVASCGKKAAKQAVLWGW